MNIKNIKNKIIKYVKNNYLVIFPIAIIVGILLYKSNFTANLNIYNKLKTTIHAVAEAASYEGGGVSVPMGANLLIIARNWGYSDSNTNHDILIDYIIKSIKRNNEDFYNSFNNYTVEYSHNDFIITIGSRVNIKILDENGQDHWKSIKKIINIGIK